MTTAEISIVQRFADRIVERVSRRVIRQLQGEPATEGGPARVKTIWDEVCIQVQGEVSFYWEAYLEELERRLAYEVDELPKLEREAVWLQTHEGFDWRCDLEDDPKERTPPVASDDLVVHLKSELLSKAGPRSR